MLPFKRHWRNVEDKIGYTSCWPGSLKVEADQGVSLQQGGRNLSRVFAILAQLLSLTSCLDLNSSWSLGSNFEQDGSSPH